MPADLKAMYEGILASCGGADNIVTLGCCMTRLRFTVKDEALVAPDALRKVRDVAGYFYSGSQHQLIVGPSTAGKLAAYFHEHHHFLPLSAAGTEEVFAPAAAPVSQESAPAVGEVKATKTAVRQKYSSRVSRACAVIGNIFLPLIPAYIGCGLLLGITNILSKTLLASDPNTVALLSVFGNGIFFYLNAIVGYNANKEFGGTPALGVAFAGILNMPALANVTLFGAALMPGKGGVIAVLLVCWAGSWLEKRLRAWIKGSAEMFVTPTLTILLVGITSLVLIQPLAGWLSDQLALQTQNALKHGGLLAGAVLGGTFLPLVMMGIHQSLVPIHQQLVNALGANPLFPILCMAGAGQVGASLAVLFKTRNAKLKTIVKNALPVGLLGIGEPLIYGVTLPLFKPFIGACLGAAVGGAVVAAFHVTSAIPFGVSGVVLFLALSNLHSVLFYALGFVTSVICGFAFTWKMGFDDPAENE